MAGRKGIGRRALLLSTLLFATLPGRALAQAAPPPPARPDIVIFIADDLGYLDVAPNGSADARTPNLSRLASEGIGFDRAFVASPSCAPSRAALLTGLMPARNTAEANHARPDPALRKLPSYLQSLGYQVVAFGKVAHYEQTATYGFDHSARDTFHDDGAVPEAIRWLKARRDPRPLALFVGSNWPHVPWPQSGDGIDPATLTLPARSVDTPATRGARASYHAAIARMDQELGDVVAATDAVLGQDSVVLFTGDNGAQWPFGKWNLYDAGTRTPLFVRWRGVTPAGTRTQAMVSWVDILPTLVDVAGGPAPEGLDGQSFAAALRPGGSFAGREAIFTTHNNDGDINVYPARAVRTGRWKYIANLEPGHVFTTHTDQYAPLGGDAYFTSWREAAQHDPAAQAIVDAYFRRPAEELYDLESDAEETRNLAADPAHAGTVRRLRRMLADWRREQGDNRPVAGRPHLDDSPVPPGQGATP
ncbi:arylsulfatase A family protein [Croceibacterium mercuriale]|uniref:Arylsulfatase A family protein n=1 Tax=Croceibacterium mercuriale TaxID=1572751 RepID=A0A0B2C322_9SPHN|nr:sulfatase [Croceibacterium mercuriale]KHL26570.1 arylsulfatase A family protein [Croceibacterium mercuriale]